MVDTSLDPTVELKSDGVAAIAAPQRRVELVLGAGPRMSTETQVLLRQRLRSVSAVVTTGFTLFLLRQILSSDFVSSGLREVLYLQIGVMGALLTVTLTMYRRKWYSLAGLRWAELAIFGLPGCFLVVLQYQSVLLNANRGEHQWLMFNLMLCIAFWYALIFTYATFIPNTWRRAAMFITPMALAPVAVLLLQLYELPAIRDTIRMNEAVLIGLMMFVASAASVFGTHTIGALRREAFEARQLGQYRLKRLLGAGGMGEVYLAEHMLLKRPCAIKLIHAARDHDPKALARFEREVRATAELSHWNTIEIYDYGRSETGTFYYVMEYLPGLNLAELVQRFGPLPPERVIHLLTQTCEGLYEAHQAGLIHRDIKPGNIFAAKRGGKHDVAKLLDFGLVRAIHPGVDESATQDGLIAGSPLYMPPEQALADGEPDARSDIYSLGAVAYFLLTGRPPFLGQKPMQVLVAHARDPVTPPSRFRPEVPADLEQVVLRCLAKRPDDRYQDVRSLAAALAQCESAQAWTADVATRWWKEHAGAALAE